ncbi:MAG: S8 family serine peptidase [Candidatus Cloacimonetes bacterium]|nr:S8 family serine peptidase [Candidatus Cloacimonadota bacterium]MDD4560019.1 S8 family serine peptidase [Candidatus Cloacimonadota bacterium]
MKKLIIFLMLIIVSAAAFAVKFDPEWFKSRTIIGCFTTEAIPNIDGKLEYTIQDGVVHTGIASFDAIAREFKIVNLIQAHPYVQVPEWNDKGVYLQNIYRLYLDSDDRIDEAVTALSKNSYMNFAELEAINREKFVPNDPMLPSQYTHPLLQSFDAWDYVTGSHDVVVAITDSGVKWNHPDLAGNVWINPAESPGMSINWEAGTITGGNGQDAGEGGNKIDDLVGWDFKENDNNPLQTYPTNEHGTHVAGCAAAVGNNGIGVVGTAPNVSILSCKGSPSNSASSGVEFAYDQMKYSAEVGAHIINASWGGPGSGAYPNSIVNYVTDLGAVVVAAAGNEDTEHNNTYQDYPADCTNALNVAATNNVDMKASFSDYGDPIDICAPGDNILSTIIADNGYTQLGGTSMASPIVAGVAALVKSLHPEMSSEDIRFRLMATADPIDDLNPNYIGKLGTGRVNSFTATMYDKIPNISMPSMTLTELEGDGDGIPNPGETVTLNIQLENGMTGLGILWKDAHDLTAALRTNYPGVTIIDSVSTYGNGGWLYAASTAWSNSPYKFSTVADLPSEPIPFELVITSNNADPFPYRKVIPIQVELSLLQSGWPFETGGAPQGSAIIADINNDGTKEVVFADQLGKIHVRNATNQNALTGFPLTLEAPVVSSIAMSEAQNDGSRVFAASLSNNKIVAFNSNGEILFTQAAGATLRSGPVISKMQNSGAEMITVVAQNGQLHVLDFNGDSAPNYPVNLGAVYMVQPAIADLNGDGVMEIILLSLNGALNAIDANTGANISGFPVSTVSGSSQNSITVANLDADEHPELLIATSTTGFLYALNHDGSVMFQKTITGQIKSSPIIADVNNDNQKEIIIISVNGSVYVMNTDGTDLPGMPISVGANVESTPVVARFDGSDMAGIIFGDSTGKLHSVRIDGTESPNFPIKLSGNVKISAALSDVDGDDDLDIVVPDNSAFYVIDIKRPISCLEWLCYLGEYGRTGNAMNPVPNSDQVAEINSTTLYGAYPNPFNPTTNISFSLKDAGEVSLDIYNQKGQKVRSLLKGILPSGKHQMVWNGTDDNGNGVASGLYFYRMKSGKYSSTRKMILMK